MSIFDRVLAAKTEATKGVDAVPTHLLNAIRCVTFGITPSVEALDRNVVKQTMGPLAHLQGKASNTCEIELEVHGSGVLGTPPEIAPLLRACGLQETINAGTSVVYEPRTNGHEACTIYGWKDGKLWKLVGAVGTMTMAAEMGQKVMMTFSMSAAYIEPILQSAPTGTVYQSTQPIVAKATDVMNDGSVINVSSVELDAGNDVQEHYTTGNHEFVVANRNPTMTFTKDSVAAVAEWVALVAGTDAVIAGTFGSATNQLAIDAPAGRRNTVNMAERAERDTNEVVYGLYESTGDDQFALTFK